MLPRWLAVGVGLCGLALVVLAFLLDGDALERWSLRGPAFVIAGIVAFGLTIRPFPLGSITTPGLGLIVAGPLAIIIGGLATAEARLRELVVLGLGLTAFCMVLFGDLLNLPIPMVPRALADLFPAGWSSDVRLRVVAGLLALAALAVHLATRRARGPVDVADHAGRL